ncbi:hypothetical protein H6G20_02060 [Desertifilum sp. FACHB-1129]|uniref:Uncharacterized protein n=2 Tax=Desertifilum tharense IPPAS B-1220 TaxID=1781255 RepID=A0A1E5QDN5_9CYAN|nr:MULTISPECIES: hypothetical protein [Desertifilum]MDA0208975.1 hypothetical protein [Cyanobacteria bacterium FC1]MBD2310458.1 hypothetical protein [Desertifilum sp. FACHB-1129]MBD2321910.1 hypothetical protein [Desertifilum sp. FACHB-866]MBD2332037.1 hypothetical protein [Desertifilum sp. FACHB-868]OEJ72776.1 hypothetical protein BH720_22625 [Desertifilum tharense IPPAS B-1220]
MAYSDFTLVKVRNAFNLTLVENRNLFESVAGVAASEYLKQALSENLQLAVAVNSEKARSEFIIAPVLAEVRRRLNFQIGLFSGTDFNVDSSRGLAGFCDFILTRSQEQYFITSPVLIVIEAKNENIIAGLGQCVAAMVAAQLFNQNEGYAETPIYGAVTSGTNWKFLVLNGSTVSIDLPEYFIVQIDKILGILMEPFQPSLVAIE